MFTTILWAEFSRAILYVFLPSTLILEPNPEKRCMLHYDFFLDFIYLFLERGEGREKERKGNIDVRETHIKQLPLTCPH